MRRIRSSGPLRLVMRARGNLRLLLNANLFPGMKVTKMDGRGLTFACVNSAEEKVEGSPSLSTLALRFKDAALTDELMELIESEKQHKHAGKEGNEENGPEETDVEAGKADKTEQSKEGEGKEDPPEEAEGAAAKEDGAEVAE